MKIQTNEKLIIALDLPNCEEAKKLVESLDDLVSFYKIGLALIPKGGFTLAQELKRLGKKVFLDLKLFDIGQTIENTIRSLGYLEIDFLTVHGDPQVVRSASRARGKSDMKILAVTMLTSLDRKDFDESLIKEGTVTDIVTQRARKAFHAGADGVIASPNEAKEIRNLKESDGKLIITPGIRFEKISKDDQKRVSDPATAFKNGSDYIVVGRPVFSSANPRTEVLKFRYLADK